LLEEGRSLRIGSAIDEEGERAIGQALMTNADLVMWTTTTS